MNLDELQEELQRLENLLKARECGLASWNTLLRDRLQKLVNMIAAAGIKAEQP